MYLSSVVCVSVESPKAEVTLHPDLQQIFTGKRLTLRCQIQGGENNIEWRYFFKRDDVDIGSSGSELKIESVEESHRGAYTCVGKDTTMPTATVSISPPAPHYAREIVTLQCDISQHEDWNYIWFINGKEYSGCTSKSCSFTMGHDTVKYSCTLPTATVNILSPPPAPHYPGDTVILQCDMSQHEDWNYYFWFINNQDYKDCTSKTCSMKLDHNNQYSCLGRSGRPQDSQHSAILSIPVTALPKATLTVTPNPVYHGETVSLKCSVESGPAWSYRWYQDRTEIRVEQSGRHRISGDSLTISKVESSDQGQYWCRGVIRSIFSRDSDSISITVKAVPTATLQSHQTDIYTGDRVTLTCAVEGSSGWTFSWYRHTTDSDPVTSAGWSTYSFNPGSVSEGGQFWCRGGRGDPVFYTQYSSPVHINVTARPSAVVTLKPNWSQIFRGESVTLRCDIQGTEDTDWEYEWERPGVSMTRWTEQEYKIIRAEESHSGDYKCRGQRGTDQSEWSSAVKLEVKALPTATVNILSPPPAPLYPGDTVILQCDISENADWNYYFWFINGQEYSGSLPKATLTVTPNPVYHGEKVSLKCSVESGPAWSYRWYKDRTEIRVEKSGRHRISGHSLTISKVEYSDWDQYWCRGEIPSRSISTLQSDSISITVTGTVPTATLQSHQTDIYTGDRVTLTCAVEGSSGWTFSWYRHTTDSDPVTSAGWSTYSFNPGSVSEGGQFWCRGGRGDPVFYTQYSSPIHINVTARPSAVVTLKPNWSQIFRGESVTLRCDIQGTEDTDWEYEWWTPGLSMTRWTEQEYKIISADKSHSGDYKCRGQRGKHQSECSSVVKLGVKDGLQPVLRVSPSWMNPGDSVTLSCEVGDSSTGWSFSFYRAAPSLPDQPYSVELLSDREQTTGNSSTLQLAAPSHTAGYMCRAGRGETVYYSDYSNPQFHWSGDQHSSVSLSVSTNRSQHLVSESVSLSCELKGNSTGWTLKRYTGSELYTVCSSVKGSTTGSTCIIRSLNVGHSGVFWCESGSGEYSNAVNITVHVGPVILESPVHPVTEGDSVTLRCRHKTPPSSPKVDFYKDGNLIRNETTGEMTIPAVSQSDEGLYKCTYSDREESPQSWLLVRGDCCVSPGAVLPSSVGLMAGLVVTSVLLFLLILLLLGWRRFKGEKVDKTSSSSSRSSQSQSTNHVLDGVQIANQNQAPAGNAPLQHGQGVEAGPSDLTYAQIELKKMKKPKRKTGKQAESEEDTIYSKVATGPPSGGAGPSDLTYAQIDLKKMKKPKRKTGKQAESEEDTIYSKVATGPPSGGAGADDVTYAQVDLKGKKAKKSDMLTTREPDAVYSAVRTG
ncbi:Fc receptor-like protein 5 [Osmerus mordax]|uniref:Fc receptor-like protein 5 n=1 Tax=Osmerus mordax TaxID=8014 RepID=UPI00350F7B1F